MPVRIIALVCNPYASPIFQAQLTGGQWVRLSPTRYDRAERGWDARGVAK